MPLKMSSEKWWHSCLGLNVLMSVNWAQLTPLLELTSPLSVAIDIFVVNLDTHVRLKVFKWQVLQNNKVAFLYFYQEPAVK